MVGIGKGLERRESRQKALAVRARVRRKATNHLRDFGPAILLIAGLLALWEVVSRAVEMPPWLLPAPSDIGASFGEAAPLLGPHVAATVTAAAAGYALALASAVVLAAAIDRWGLARRAIYPLLVTSQTIPTFALAPLLAIWFGFGLLPKVLVVALVCFFPIVVATVGGLRAADKEMLDLVRGMGASDRQLFLKVRLPAAVPSVISGMKIAATYSVIGAVIAEWTGASQGLGLYLLRASNSFQTDQVFAVIAVIALLSIALFGCVELVGRTVAPWTAAKEETAR